jgi:MGT family glycosyltransferase
MNRHVLLAAHPTVGHTNAMRAIGGELRARGHATSFALVRARLPFSGLWPEPVRAAAALPHAIAAEGARVVPLPTSVRALWHAARLPRATGLGELEVALALFTSAMEVQARRIAAHAHRAGAAVVVADYLMPAAMLGARRAGLPFAALYHSALPFPTASASPFGSGLPESARGTQAWRAAERRLERLSAVFDARVARVAARLGLPSPRAGLLRRPMSTDLNLLATTPELEPGLLPLDGPAIMTGPCTPRAAPVDDAGRQVLASLPTGARTVYVSLGTVFNHKSAVFRVLIDGAISTGASVVVSAGASLDVLAPLRSARVAVFERVPQLEVLRRVHSVITHGGNNTVQECLAAGRPMVVVPFGGDQIANAQRVERLGVGVRLSAGALSAPAVRDALARLDAPSVGERATALCAALGRYGGASAAADAVLALTKD